MSEIARQLRIAARRLKSTPSFTVTTTLVLGLSLGFGTAFFGLLNSLVLRPMEFERSSGVVRVTWGRGNQEIFGGVLPPGVSSQLFGNGDLRTLSLAGYSRQELGFAISGNVQVLSAELIVGHYFEVVEARLVAGRLLTPLDDAPSSPAVVVVSRRVWNVARSEGLDILNRTALVGGQLHTIVGVVGDDFPGVALRGVPTDLWMPARERPVGHAFGRLRDRATLQQANTELKSRVHLELRHAAFSLGAKLGMLPSLPIGAYLFAASGLALCAVIVVVAGSSAANLILARVAGRRAEIAIRLMLGATDRNVRRLFSAELAIIGLGAAVVSLGSAVSAVWLGQLILPGADRFVVALRLDWRLLGYAGIAAGSSMAVLARLVAGHASRVDALAAVSATGGSGGSTALATITSDRLVGVQVGGATLLLVLSTVLVGATSIGPIFGDGFRPEGSAVGWLDHRHNGLVGDRGSLAESGLLEAARALAGSGSVALASDLPVGASRATTSAVADSGHISRVSVTGVTSSFFSAFGIALHAGRDFSLNEIGDGSPVAMVSAAAATMLWPGTSPLGRTVRLTESEGAITFEVIGVVADIRPYDPFRDRAVPLFVPMRRVKPTRVAILAKADGGAGASVQVLKSAVNAVGGQIALEDLGTLESALQRSVGGRRAAGTLLSAMALLSMTIALVGVYGVVAHLVSQRRRECGILLSIGAPKGHVVRRLTGATTRRIITGTVVGVLISIPCCIALRSYVWDLRPRDWAVVSSVPIAVVFVGLAAAALPVLGLVRRPIADLMR